MAEIEIENSRGVSALAGQQCKQLVELSNTSIALPIAHHLEIVSSVRPCTAPEASSFTMLLQIVCALLLSSSLAYRLNRSQWRPLTHLGARPKKNYGIGQKKTQLVEPTTVVAVPAPAAVAPVAVPSAAAPIAAAPVAVPVSPAAVAPAAVAPAAVAPAAVAPAVAPVAAPVAVKVPVAMGKAKTEAKVPTQALEAPMKKGYGIGSNASKWKVAPAPTTPVPIPAPIPPIEAAAPAKEVIAPVEVAVAVEAVVKKVVEAETEVEVAAEVVAQVVAEVEAQVESVADAQVDVEDVLKQQVSKEFLLRERRSAESSQLQSKLTASIKRSAEVESVALREMDSLREALAAELDSERLRLTQLQSLYASFTTALLQKTALLQSESGILLQMREVREKIAEKVILAQLDEAISSKDSLVKIERSICEDIRSSGDSINQEISATSSKIQYLTATYDTLPALDDAPAARGYSWASVESLQAKLLSSVAEAAPRDQKITGFAETFSALMSRRGLVLGENTQLPPMLDSKMGEIRGEVMDARVVEGRVRGDTSRSNTTSKEARMSKTQLGEILKAQSDAEFSATASEALKRTLVSLASATAGLLQASSKFFGSPEAAEAQEALGGAVTSLGDVGAGVRSAFSAARSTWDSELQGMDSVKSSDEYMSRVFGGIQEVLRSAELQSALGRVGSSGRSSVAGVGIAASRAGSRISQELGESDRFAQAVEDLSGSVTVLLTVLGVGAGRVIEGRRDRQLPE